jgi:hypothetical protein
MKDTVFLVKSAIYGHGRGWCFTPKDFIALDNPQAVRKALSRLRAGGFINRIGWGLYEYPKKHEILGQLPPDIEQVAKAITRGSKIKILPSGAYATNLLGLSEQVPGKIIYLTDGPSRKIKVGKTELIFKRTTLKNMAAAGTLVGVVIQALRYLGKEHIDDTVIAKLKKRLSKQELTLLHKQGLLTSDWLRKIINNIVHDGIEDE